MSAVDGIAQENLSKCVQRSHSLILINELTSSSVCVQFRQWFIANSDHFGHSSCRSHGPDAIQRQGATNHSMKSGVLENYTKNRLNVCFRKFPFEFNVSSHYKDDIINLLKSSAFAASSHLISSFWCFRKERQFAVEWNYLLNTK